MPTYVTEERWCRLLSSIGVRCTNSTYAELIAAYSEKHRHYHTVEHIEACLKHLDAANELGVHRDEIELALWFHDAIYDPYKSGNEEKSAEWACDFLRAHEADPNFIDRIRNLILATKHDVTSTDAAAQLLVDIDLAILGASEIVYSEFERNVREEYKWVPGVVFRKKRAEILQSFLDRPQIYSTRYFKDRFEHQARKNLNSAIDALRA